MAAASRSACSSGKVVFPIHIIVGLGNPGDTYRETRHNAGFWFLDEVARRHGAVFKKEPKFHGVVATLREDGRDIYLLKPATFMNNSGRAVSALARFYKIDRAKILVAHDELDLPCGTLRLKTGGGHAGHNGVRDIIAALGGKDFWRLRIGVGHPGDTSQVTGYVLRRPDNAERQQINERLMDTQVLDLILSGDMDAAMLNLHSR